MYHKINGRFKAIRHYTSLDISSVPSVPLGSLVSQNVLDPRRAAPNFNPLW